MDGERGDSAEWSQTVVVVSSMNPILWMVIEDMQSGDVYVEPGVTCECISNRSEYVTQQTPGDIPEPWPVP